MSSNISLSSHSILNLSHPFHCVDWARLVFGNISKMGKSRMIFAGRGGRQNLHRRRGLILFSMFKHWAVSCTKIVPSLRNSCFSSQGFYILSTELLTSIIEISHFSLSITPLSNLAPCRIQLLPLADSLS